MGALCAAGSLASACATAVASRPPGTLVVVYPADANTLDPLVARNEPASLFYDFIVDGLGDRLVQDAHPHFRLLGSKRRTATAHPLCKELLQSELAARREAPRLVSPNVSRIRRPPKRDS